MQGADSELTALQKALREMGYDVLEIAQGEEFGFGLFDEVFIFEVMISFVNFVDFIDNRPKFSDNPFVSIAYNFLQQNIEHLF